MEERGIDKRGKREKEEGKGKDRWERAVGREENRQKGNGEEKEEGRGGKD